MRTDAVYTVTQDVCGLKLESDQGMTFWGWIAGDTANLSGRYGMTRVHAIQFNLVDGADGDTIAEGDSTWTWFDDDSSDLCSGTTATVARRVWTPSPPTPPGSLRADLFDNSAILLRWIDRSIDETAFEIRRRIVGQAGFASVAAVGVEGTSFVDTELAPSTTYEYQVVARNPGGEGTSNTALATTLAVPKIGPNPPTGLSAIALDHERILVTWSDRSDNESGFHITRSGLSGDGSGSQMMSVGKNVTQFEDRNLDPDTAYDYEVSAYNAAGAASAGQVSTITDPQPTPNTPPEAPSNFWAPPLSSSNSSIELQWTDNSSTEDRFLLVVRRFDSADRSFHSLPRNTTAFTIEDLDPGQTYEFKLTAENTVGSSPIEYTLGATLLR